MTAIRLYHGTAHRFDAFRLTCDTRGEPNSALGVHLTECPHLAAQYAEIAGRDLGSGEPVVLLVDAEVGKVGLLTCQASFFGGDLSTSPSKRTGVGSFARERERLMTKGFSAIALDVAHDDLDGAWVLLDPRDAVIAGRIAASSHEVEDLPRGGHPDFAATPITLATTCGAHP